MRVLVACEFSGIVRDAFIARGHDAVSCDLLPTERPGPHIQGDATALLGGGWDLLVGHPPCTYLANSGVQHLHRDADRWALLDEGAAFFRTLLEAPIPRIAIENPIPHKYAIERIGRTYTQIVHPWMFGHPEMKATCLWLKNLPPLMKTDDVKHLMVQRPKREQQRLHYLSPGPNRAKERSKTFSGLAEAMASQWSEDLTAVAVNE